MQQLQNMRRLPLTGANNTRDLGGFACEGGVTRWRQFLRSDGTGRLTEADIETLRAYGVTDWIDLRSAHETGKDPSRLVDMAGFTGHHVPMLDNIMSSAAKGEAPSAAKHGLGELYVALLQHGGEDFARIFRIFAAAKGGVLFHCAVGKDRTGTLAMLLLKLAGVPEEDILADYAVSEIYLAQLMQRRVEEFSKSGIAAKLLRSEPENMRTALEYIANNHGTVPAYLQSIGLTGEEVHAVKQKLVG